MFPPRFRNTETCDFVLWDIMNKLSIPGGTHTNHAFRLKDNRHLQKADTEVMAKEEMLCPE